MADTLIFAAGSFTFLLLVGGLFYSIHEVRRASVGAGRK